jgi:RNA polymerase sigma-70 factor, ECF subfamily
VTAADGSKAPRRVPARELDDVTLVRAQRGEDVACRALVKRYEVVVFALLGRLLGSRRDPRLEDLAQETFLRVFRALPDFSRTGTARLSTWILTIATRLALDELRRRPPQMTSLDDDLPAGGGGVDDRLAAARALKQATLALTPDHRAVLLLREFHELDYEEIARVLQIDVGTVKSRLARARAAVRRALKESDDHV